MNLFYLCTLICDGGWGVCFLFGKGCKGLCILFERLKTAILCGINY